MFFLSVFKFCIGLISFSAVAVTDLRAGTDEPSDREKIIEAISRVSIGNIVVPSNLCCSYTTRFVVAISCDSYNPKTIDDRRRVFSDAGGKAGGFSDKAHKARTTGRGLTSKGRCFCPCPERGFTKPEKTEEACRGILGYGDFTVVSNGYNHYPNGACINCGDTSQEVSGFKFSDCFYRVETSYLEDGKRKESYFGWRVVPSHKWEGFTDYRRYRRVERLIVKVRKIPEEYKNIFEQMPEKEFENICLNFELGFCDDKT